MIPPLLICAAALILIALERRFPYDRQQPLLRPGFFTDLVFYGLIQGYAVVFFVRWLLQSIHYQAGLVSAWPVAAQALFFFVARDLYIYCYHRWQHSPAVRTASPPTTGSLMHLNKPARRKSSLR